MRTKESIKNHFIIITTLMLIGFAIYSNSLHGEFISDDYGSIIEHKNILVNFNIKNLWDAYNTRIIGGLTFALNYWLNKENVIGYHALNVIIHVINSILIYFFILQIFKTPRLNTTSIAHHKNEVAFLASLIFLAHPIQTQAVSYIVQRYTSLAAFFYIATLLFYGNANFSGKKIFYLLSFSSFIFCLLTKEIGLTLPFMIILYGTFFWDLTKSDVKKLGIFISGGIGFIVFILLVAMTRINNDLFTSSSNVNFPWIWQYFLTEINVLRTYLRMLFLPIHLSLSYDYNISKSIFETNTALSLILLISILLFALWLFKKGYRHMTFSILWFFITLSIPVSFAVIYGKNGAGLLYDHWLYLPMVGFSLFIVSATYNLTGIKWTKIIMGLAVIVLCLLTFQRNKVWRTEIGLWEDVVKNNPASIVNNLALGCAYQRKGIDKKAYIIYDEINKKYKDKQPKEMLFTDRIYLSRAYNNMGIICINLGKDDQAIKSFKKALIFQPSNKDASSNLKLLKSEN